MGQSTSLHSDEVGGPEEGEIVEDYFPLKTKGEGLNVADSLLNRQTRGHRPPRKLSNAQRLVNFGGPALLDRLNRPSDYMVTLVDQLREAVDTSNATKLTNVVTTLSNRLLGEDVEPDAPKFYAGGGKIGIERDAFWQAGGVQCLMAIFKNPEFVGRKVASSRDARFLERLPHAALWNETTAILRELVFFIPDIQSTMQRHDPRFVPFLFTLLSHDLCFDTTAILIEEILSVLAQKKNTTFALSEVPNLYQLWRGFSARQLAHFCRILALLIFEPEDRALIESPTVLKSVQLLHLRRNRAARHDATVDQNQSLLLSDPILIERLVLLLRILNYAPPIRQASHVLHHFPMVADTLIMLGLVELEDWNELANLDSCAQNASARVADLLQNLQLDSNQNQLAHVMQIITAAQEYGIGRLAQPNEPQDAANTLQFNGMLLGPYQVELLFVLCTLAGGRRKIDAQDKLIEMGLFGVLGNMFGRLPWGPLPPVHEGIHGPGCECSPESALCVQFLRLLHNLADRDVDNYHGRRVLCEEQSSGLRNQLIQAFMNESDDSPYRFWMASCLESFLRGSAEQQGLIAASGLLEHLVTDIVQPKLHCSGSLQTSFDLMGELTKGNRTVMNSLLKLVEGDQLETLLRVATSNLVDSNVFLRSLILTTERTTFDTCPSGYLTHSWWDVSFTGPQMATEWFVQPLIVRGAVPPLADMWQYPTKATHDSLQWFLRSHQAMLLSELLKVVDLSNINHENICCANSAVLLAIMASRHGRLGLLVQSLDEPSRRNFREIVWFWREYYGQRGRDRLSLEFSTHVRYREWEQVVDLITRDDGSDTALMTTPIPLPRSPYHMAPQYDPLSSGT